MTALREAEIQFDEKQSDNHQRISDYVDFLSRLLRLVKKQRLTSYNDPDSRNAAISSEKLSVSKTTKKQNKHKNKELHRFYILTEPSTSAKHTTKSKSTDFVCIVHHMDESKSVGPFQSKKSIFSPLGIVHMRRIAKLAHSHIPPESCKRPIKFIFVGDDVKNRVTNSAMQFLESKFQQVILLCNSEIHEYKRKVENIISIIRSNTIWSDASSTRNTSFFRNIEFTKFARVCCNEVALRLCAVSPGDLILYKRDPVTHLGIPKSYYLRMAL